MNLQKLSILMYSTKLEEWLKDPLLSTVGSWTSEGVSLDPKAPKIQQPKGLLWHCHGLDWLLLEEHGQLLCYNEPSDPLDEKKLQFCLPVSLVSPCSQMGLYNQLTGHIGASKTYVDAKGLFWPGMFDWICFLTAGCLACPNNKPKPKHPNAVTLEEKQGHSAPFCEINFDPKGPLHPPSNRKTYCLSIVVSFSIFSKIHIQNIYQLWLRNIYRRKNGTINFLNDS